MTATAQTVIMTNGRRGRPKQEPRAARDLGTHELQSKRLALAGLGRDGLPNNPALAEYPLGILLARRLISQDQHNAGLRYAALYAKAIGRSADLGIDHGLGAALDDTASARIEAQYRACKNRLLAAGRRVADAADNCTVYRRLPRWATMARRRRSDWPERAALIDGLDILVACLIGRPLARPGKREYTGNGT